MKDVVGGRILFGGRVRRYGRERRRGWTHGEWEDRAAQGSIALLAGIKKAELKRRKHFDFVILRNDDLFEALGARQAERIARLDFRGRWISFEVLPIRLWRQCHPVQQSLTLNLHLQRDR